MSIVCKKVTKIICFELCAHILVGGIEISSENKEKFSEDDIFQYGMSCPDPFFLDTFFSDVCEASRDRIAKWLKAERR